MEGGYWGCREGKWYWRRRGKWGNRQGRALLRAESEGAGPAERKGERKAEAEWDDLTVVEQQYVERRIRGMDPVMAARDILTADRKQVRQGVIYRTARSLEKQTKHLLAQMAEGEGMSDEAFEAWEDRQVREMAEASQGTGRLQALKWLRDRREERKYLNEEALFHTISTGAETMERLRAIMAEGGGSDAGMVR